MLSAEKNRQEEGNPPSPETNDSLDAISLALFSF